jgi:flagellar biosynthesis/type III secretory pathway M-ring protein FliF/YscJ
MISWTTIFLLLGIFLFVGLIILYFSVDTSSPQQKSKNTIKNPQPQKLTKQETKEILENTKEIVKENPQLSAEAIRKWLNQDKN